MDWQKLTTTLTLQTFSDLCFLTPIPEEDAGPSELPSHGVAVRFQSADPDAPPCAEGCLWLGVDPEVGRSAVESMLAIDDVDACTLEDGLAELANVIVGAVFHNGASCSDHRLSAPDRNVPVPHDEGTLFTASVPFPMGRVYVRIAREG